MANSDHITNEKDFKMPEGWSVVERPPIEGGGAPVPPVPVDRFASGAISTMTLGLNTDIADSQMGGSVPVYRVQPPQPSSIAAVVAATQSTQILVPPPATSGGGGTTTPDIEIINSNVQTVTDYLVQLTDRDTLISMTNNAGGTVTLPGGTTNFSVVRSAIGGGAGSGANAPIANDFGNTMVAAVYSSPNGGFIPNIVTDSLGNVWTMINDHATAGGQQVSLWVAYNIRAGSNIVNAVQPLGTQFCMVIVHEFLGVLANGLDQVAFGTGSATILPTVANTFAYCSARFNSLSTTQLTPGTSTPWINLLWNAIQWTNPPGPPPTQYLNGVDEFQANVPVATLVGDATGPTAATSDFVMANFRTTTFTPGVFPVGWYTYVQNTGTGTFLVQSVAKIDGKIQTISLPPNTGILVVSDGSQYWTDRGIGSNVLFETNGTPNAVQNVLDLNAGTNITLVNGGGVVTISASGGTTTFFKLFSYPPTMGGASINVSFNGGGNVGQTTNGIGLWALDITESYTVSELLIHINSSDTNHNDFGLYNSAGALVCNIGATVFSTTGLKKVALLQGAITISPGSYFFAWTMDAAAGVTIAGAPVGGGTYFFLARSVSSTPMWLTTATASSGGVLPSTITPPTLSTATNVTDNDTAGSTARPAFGLSGY